MKIQLPIQKFASEINANFEGKDTMLIDAVVFDTRKIANPKNQAFFALSGNFRNGHAYIEEAYKKGIRCFVVSENMEKHAFEGAIFLKVEDTLEALQKIAAFHRKKFDYPVLAITGSVGKSTVKEWIYHLISAEIQVIRSPKSYNSQLGVALSLLEMDAHHELAIIEAGISEAGEMLKLEKMIKPTLGIFTAFGSAHAENFSSSEIHLAEKLKLFEHVSKTWYNQNIPLSEEQRKTICGTAVKQAEFQNLLAQSPFQDKASLENLAIAIAFAIDLGINSDKIKARIKDLPRLALRMETFDGIQGNIIINDTYNLDLDALTQSLEYQLSIANGRKRIAIIASENLSTKQQTEIDQKLSDFKLEGIFQVDADETIPLESIENSVVLIKGTRSTHLQRLAGLFQLKKHKTRVEIDLSAVRHNLDYFRSLTKKGTKILVMVKASSYGSGAEKMAEFLQKSGVEYLGVAYADEGVELRKHGITLPILVMNAEEDGFKDIINYDLEPALYSYAMMDQFIRALIMENKETYPVHLKFDTGMHRLGFAPEEIERVIDVFQAQPEIILKGVYSHLAESDNQEDQSFTQQQITLFEEIIRKLKSKISNDFICHLLNTEGIANFPQAHYEMVRIGIGIYGYSSNQKVESSLKSAITWKSVVSQIKTVHKGESVGYGRKFIADQEYKIATIPVGYADGFRRSLGLGKGGMYVQGKYCKVVGSVCMDMTMIDVTEIETIEGDSVEIIGTNQSVSALAKKMDTIVYEVLTSISKRVQRIYVEE